MARVDEDKDQRDQTPLVLENVLECELCGTEFEEEFTCPDGIYEREDLVDAPEKDVTCPGCGNEWHATWEGWLSHEDAG